MEPEFPSNSRKAREQPDEKKIESVVTGKVVRRKKSPGKRFGELFVSGDSKTVGQYVILDVMLPALKDMIADGMSQGVERMLFGDSRPVGRRPGSRPMGSTGPSGHVSYNRFSSSTREEPRNRMSRQAKASHSFDEIVLSTRAEAEEVLNRLYDLIARYQVASVSDLYNLIDEPANFADEKWGWDDIEGSQVRRTSGGYLLDLPRPKAID